MATIAPPAGVTGWRSLTGGKTTPARLRLLLAVTIAASLLWGGRPPRGPQASARPPRTTW
jgi:hypothetical protein